MTHLMRHSVILGCICAANCSVARAAPKTVRFEAIVDRPRQGVSAPVPPSWDFDLQQGDTVSGFFTIESFDAAASAYETYRVEQSNFTLRIKSQTVTTSQFEVYAVNNVWGDDIDTPYDSIQVGCSYAGCNPAIVPHSDSLRWWARIYAYGNTEILEGPDIPADLDAWQRFDDNSILVSFSNSRTEYYGFLATVRFIAVPEPAAWLLVSCGLPVLLRWRWRR
jgi:hypothetical protein